MKSYYPGNVPPALIGDGQSYNRTALGTHACAFPEGSPLASGLRLASAYFPGVHPDGPFHRQACACAGLRWLRLLGCCRIGCRWCQYCVGASTCSAFPARPSALFPSRENACYAFQHPRLSINAIIVLNCVHPLARRNLTLGWRARLAHAAEAWGRYSPAGPPNAVVVASAFWDVARLHHHEPGELANDALSPVLLRAWAANFTAVVNGAKAAFPGAGGFLFHTSLPPRLLLETGVAQVPCPLAPCCRVVHFELACFHRPLIFSLLYCTYDAPPTSAAWNGRIAPQFDASLTLSMTLPRCCVLNVGPLPGPTILHPAAQRSRARGRGSPRHGHS